MLQMSIIHFELDYSCKFISYIYNMSPSLNIWHQRILMRIINRVYDHIKVNNGKCEFYFTYPCFKINDGTVVLLD